MNNFPSNIIIMFWKKYQLYIISITANFLFILSFSGSIASADTKDMTGGIGAPANQPAQIRISWQMEVKYRILVDYFKLMRRREGAAVEWRDELGPEHDGKLPNDYIYIIDEVAEPGDYYYHIESAGYDDNISSSDIKVKVACFQAVCHLAALNDNYVPVGLLQTADIACENNWPMLHVAGWSYDPDNLAFGGTIVHIYDKDFSQVGLFQYIFNNIVNGSTTVPVENKTALVDMGRRGYTPVSGKQYGFDIKRPLPANEKFAPGAKLDINAYAINNGPKNQRLSRAGGPAKFQLTVPDCGQKTAKTIKFSKIKEQCPTMDFNGNKVIDDDDVLKLDQLLFSAHNVYNPEYDCDCNGSLDFYDLIAVQQTSFKQWPSAQDSGCAARDIFFSKILLGFYALASTDTVTISWIISEQKINEISGFEIWYRNAEQEKGEWQIKNAKISSQERLLTIPFPIEEGINNYEFGIHVLLTSGLIFDERMAKLEPTWVYFQETGPLADPIFPVDANLQPMNQPFPSTRANEVKALVLIDNGLYNKLNPEVDEYIALAQSRRKFLIARDSNKLVDNYSFLQVRELVKNYRKEYPALEGVLFIGDIELPTFYKNRDDLLDVRYFPSYYEDLDMKLVRNYALGAIDPKCDETTKPYCNVRHNYTVPEHHFDEIKSFPIDMDIWTSYLPVGGNDISSGDYNGFAEQLKPFFNKAADFYKGKYSPQPKMYIVSNDLSGNQDRNFWELYKDVSAIDFYAMNPDADGTVSPTTATNKYCLRNGRTAKDCYQRVALEDYASDRDFRTVYNQREWMGEDWQIPDIFLNHMTSNNYEFVVVTVHSFPSESIIKSDKARELSNGGMIMLASGCGVAGFKQKNLSVAGGSIYAPFPAENILVSYLYGSSNFLAAVGSPFSRAHADKFDDLVYYMKQNGDYLGAANFKRMRLLSQIANNSFELRELLNEMLLGDPFLDVSRY